MQIAPFLYIRHTPNFDQSKWPMCLSNQPSPQANLLAHMDSMREEHTCYISELARHNNEVLCGAHSLVNLAQFICMATN